MPSAPARETRIGAAPWLRPLLVAVVTLAHGAALVAASWPKPADVSVPVTLQVDIVAGGEAAHAVTPTPGDEVAESKSSAAQAGEVAPVEAKPVDEATPAEPIAQPDVAEVTPPTDAREVAPVDAPATPPPDVRSAALEPVAPAVEEPKPQPQPSEPNVRERRRKAEEAERRRKAEEAERRKHEAETRKRAAAAAARLASRAGSDTSHGRSGAATNGAAAADYRARVIAEINRHKRYPSSAGGVSGTVVVAFTVGASGRVASISIIQSSGHSVLDGAARQIVSAMSLPPPPGGQFKVAAAPIRFRTNE